MNESFTQVAEVRSLRFATQHADVAAFLRSFFEAVARRDWPAVAVSFHANASLFSVDQYTSEPAVLRWDAAAAAFRRWLENSAGINQFKNLAEELELSVADKAALITLPSRKGAQAGSRVMVVTYEDERWQVHHLHLARLQIPLFVSDIAG